MAPRKEKTTDPFYAELERFIGEVMEAKPDSEVLREWARKYPDKYGSLIGALYRARDGANPNVGRSPHTMSDMELQEAVLREAREMLAEAGFDLVERPKPISNVEPLRRIVHEG